MSEEQPENQQQDSPEVVVLDPSTMAMGRAGGDDESEDGEKNLTDLVEQPAKVMRIGSMIRTLLEEVKSAPLDEPSRAACSTSAAICGVNGRQSTARRMGRARGSRIGTGVGN